MPLFTKDSLDRLRQSVDLVEVVGKHIELKAAGTAYKALCPFHDEKSPSFSIQRGDSHYHCFGCGAHGDAIQFLMTHLQLSFADSVEQLAQEFNVQLDFQEGTGERKNTRGLKEALESACQFYECMLLHSQEGREALEYLFSRGIDLDFIRRFRVGLAPKGRGIFRKVMKEKGIPVRDLLSTGLAVEREGRGLGDFFYERITFPICDAMGSVIGFSARKFKEATFGGKYVNTPDTDLFKKWRVLFGLHHCRRQIAKQRKVIIVEGQLDALRLIQEGIDIAVAGQGTAFGEGHVEPLVKLGVQKVFLSLDSDDAGKTASVKIGSLFQRRGIDVRVVKLPKGEDPDSFLQLKGPLAFRSLLDQAEEYLAFLIAYHMQQVDTTTPAGMNLLIATVSGIIREWEDPVMIHESLRRLAALTGVPEQAVGIGQIAPNVHYRNSDTAGKEDVDPNLVLERDLLTWLLLRGEKEPSILELAIKNISVSSLQSSVCRELYGLYLERRSENLSCDITHLSNCCETIEMGELVENILRRKLNLDRREEQFTATIEKILQREWMKECEALHRQIVSGALSDEEALNVAKRFGELKRNQPKVNLAVGDQEVRNVEG